MNPTPIVDRPAWRARIGVSALFLVNGAFVATILPRLPAIKAGLGLSNAELGTALARRIGGHFVQVDVTDETAVAAAIREAEGLHGKARILVNCAGIGPPAKVIDREGQPLPLASF